ncbi:MAG: hypothetical protein E6H80_05120 [Betaproteobacteria bacterium]|nr:MAG: hypothetical protein E6H80_05120 [Betaproteobacteria bacterium]
MNLILRVFFTAALTGVFFVQAHEVLAQPQSQRELNGFALGQHNSAIKAAFKKLYDERRTEDGWIYRTYLISEKPFVYMSFKFPADDIDHAVSIQIAGDPTKRMLPFLGLKLGASAEDVRRHIGRPSETTQLTDPPVEVWKYQGRNYSFELDKVKGLSSIQVFGYQGFGEPPGLPTPWPEVRSRLLSNDVTQLMTTFAADAEIYHGRDVYGIDNSLWTVLSDSKSKFRRGLALVVLAIQDDRAREPGEANLRISRNQPVRHVYKFRPGSPVEEIVLTPHAGAFRVWEIRLR